MKKLKSFIFLAGVWVVLLGLTFAFSRDVFQYHCWFDDALALPPIDRFFGVNSHFQDPTYYVLQAIGTILFPFKIFFGLLILAALTIKLFALLRITPSPTWLDVLPFLMVLSFLHEGTQIRVALALSITLWAIVWFAEGRRLQALLILCVAATFHLSVACFFIVFFMIVLYEQMGPWILVIIAFVAAVMSYSSFVGNWVLQLGEATHARYMAYSVGAIYRRQNSSGLFQYFTFFVGGLTILIWKLTIPNVKPWQELKKIALISGFLGVMILQVFSFNVVIASRLADLLLLPLVLVLGSALVQLRRENKKRVLGVVIIILIIYGCVRGLLVYLPEPNAVMVCHPELLPSGDIPKVQK